MEHAPETRKPSDSDHVDLGGAIAEATTRTRTESLIRKGISSLRIVNETKLLRLVSELVEDAVHARLSMARLGDPTTLREAFPPGTIFDDQPRDRLPAAGIPDVYILDEGLEWTTATRPGAASGMPARSSSPPFEEDASDLQRRRRIAQDRHSEALGRIERSFSRIEESMERMERFLDGSPGPAGRT